MQVNHTKSLNVRGVRVAEDFFFSHYVMYVETYNNLPKEIKEINTLNLFKEDSF